MAIAAAPIDADGASFLPQLTEGAEGRATVLLLRRMPGGDLVAVWSHACPASEAGRLAAWMSAEPGEWAFWGRIALRLGADAAGSIILRRARDADEERIAEEREREREEQQRLRLAAEITLYRYDPKGKAPSLGLERGCDDAPFWRMRFGEKWERDRVVDWLRWQKSDFRDLEAYFHEFGALELERRVLAGMRAAEKAAKAKGLTSAGRRPLRFWRGEE